MTGCSVLGSDRSALLPRHGQCFTTLDIPSQLSVDWFDMYAKNSWIICRISTIFV